MAKIHGKSGNVSWGGSDEDGIKNWSLSYSGDVVETTDFAAGGTKTYIAGGTGWSGSFSGDKDGAPLCAPCTSGALILEESETATQRFSGTAIITEFSATTDAAGVPTYSYSFQGTGDLTIATT